ncbi:mannosyltransferase family protein [Oligoflexus tunisiensis]|uniref:mannosyltransferase family protein n=1 Tax=Oligoflexus tunisiensis TaxID=708132 RepID=UPI00114D2C82|nr:mannosyltransferase family protein [Oligoflexus tunisiensis]
MPHQPRVHGKIIAKFQGLDYRNPALFHSAAARPSLSQCMGLALVVGVVHVLLWLVVLQRSDTSWSALLQHWDAGWYLRIATQGYDAASAAFPPLFPYMARGLTTLFGLSGVTATLAVGTLLSVVCFALSLTLLVARRGPRPESWLTWGGLLFFLWSPASYIFHSFHTESLFLLLSVLGFTALHQKKWWLAAIWAGLAALTRHQGVFLAMALAFGGMLMAQEKKPLQRLGIFVGMGVISGLLWGLAPLLHFWEGRGWFPAMGAHQSHWFIADGISTYFKTFLLANPIQNLRVGSLLHHLFYGLWLAGTLLLFRRGRFAEALYCFLSLAIMPLQGELVDAFRFGAVLFPLLFVLGDAWERLPRWAGWPLLALYGLLNLVVTWQYGILRWAY